ncbi:MAG: hypothetical protein Q7S60_01710 [bacterium]|nr:hypothetical protein [bacterium]
MYKLLSAIFGALVFFFSSTSSAFALPQINEFLAHPTTGDEWVEFYNPDNVDLSDYWLDDDLNFASDSGSSAKKKPLFIIRSDSKIRIFNIRFFFKQYR